MLFVSTDCLFVTLFVVHLERIVLFDYMTVSKKLLMNPSKPGGLVQFLHLKSSMMLKQPTCRAKMIPNQASHSKAKGI